MRLQRTAAGRGTAALATVASCALLPACGGARLASRPDPVVAEPVIHSFFIPIPENTRWQVAAAAARLVGHGRAPFRVEGRRFSPDCGGLVAAAYQAAGIPLREALHLTGEDAGSAVVALHRAVAANGLLLGSEAQPFPGDLVFWHDTYDRNGNGLADDPVTHVGIVERTARDGTVTFVHRGSRGVARGVMDLRRPWAARDAAGRQLNSKLRPAQAGDPEGTRYLAGELFAAFGRLDAARIAAALEGSSDLSLAALGLDE